MGGRGTRDLDSLHPTLVREGMTTPEDAVPETSDVEPSDLAAAPRTISAGRPRIATAVVETDRGWHAVVKIVLERDGVLGEAQREAVGEEAVVLRCVAEATLDAIASLTGQSEQFALVGIKRVLAFDSAVLLACVRTLEGGPRKLLGCVPIQDDTTAAAASAVLNATNRIVETMPNSAAADSPQ